MPEKRQVGEEYPIEVQKDNLEFSHLADFQFVDTRIVNACGADVV
jgi:hypothetical protein